jgi:8-oxo-dGTP pyrophosphatase MutT (NUDIX family)
MAKSRKKAKVLRGRTVFSGPIFKVTSETVAEPNGVTTRRDVVRHPGSIVILAVDERGRMPRVLLEKQYRYVAEKEIWELPAGRIDPGESELAAAKRELLEETGYRAKQWRHLFTYYASPGFLDETMALWLGRELTQGEAEPEEDEVIHVELVPLARVLAMIKNGTIHDGKTIAALLWYARWEARSR